MKITIILKMKVVDAYKWNCALRCLLNSNQPNKSLLAVSRLRRNGTQIDTHTFLLLKACTHLPTHQPLSMAQQLHALTLKLGFHSNKFLNTSFLCFYSLHGDLHSAHNLFDETPQRDTPLWNALISAYSQRKIPDKVISIFRDMISEGVRPTDSTSVILLSACSQLTAPAHGKSVHAYVLRNLILLDTFICNSLIDMYSKCGCLAAAYVIFGRMRSRNVVSWTAMINGFVDNDRPYEALALLKEMEAEGVVPDEATVLSAISMCTRFTSSDVNKWIDGFAERRWYWKSTRVENALICMLCKRGDLEHASRIFKGMAERSVASWSSMIQGLAMHGHGIAALVRFVQMQREGFVPDAIVFVSVISACSHAGLVVEGKECFRSMVEDYGLVPSIEHYGGMVDLFCRAGLVHEALDFVSRMPVTPDAAIWRVLIGACRDEGDSSTARNVMHLLLGLDPEHCGNHVLKSNLHAMMEEWEDAEEARKKMKLFGIGKKEPGFSFFAVDAKY